MSAIPITPDMTDVRDKVGTTPTPITDLIADLMSQNVPWDTALMAAKHLEETLALTPRGGGSTTERRRYERERKAEYRERKSRELSGTMSGTDASVSLIDKTQRLKVKEETLFRLVPGQAGHQSDWPKDYREQFWTQFPRRVEKAAAMRKLEAINRGGTVKWADFIDGVKRYAASCRGKEQRYVKHPTTWLNKGCWSDEPEQGGPNGIVGRGGQQDLGFNGIAAQIRARGAGGPY